MHYTGTIWRPPYEAYSLLIQVTAGCTHHSCKFCTLYEDLPFKFRMSPLEEVKSDLKEANHYYKDADRVFFTGANPFVLSVDKLKTLAKMVHEYFPNCQSIGCFARITDVSQKSVKDLQELKDLGYDGITFGIETGDDEALVFEGLTDASWISRPLKVWIEASGIKKHITFHCGRHSYASLLLENGVDIYTIKSLMGHTNVKTTQIYTHIVNEQKEKAANTLHIENLDL